MKTIRQNTRLQAILQATTLFGFALYFTGYFRGGIPLCARTAYTHAVVFSSGIFSYRYAQA